MRGLAPELWRFAGWVEDPTGEERWVTYTYTVTHESQSHPFGSTTATESWSEVDDEDAEFTLDDREVTLDDLQETLGGTPDEATLERWRNAAKLVGIVDGGPD